MDQRMTVWPCSGRNWQIVFDGRRKASDHFDRPCADADHLLIDQTIQADIRGSGTEDGRGTAEVVCYRGNSGHDLSVLEGSVCPIAARAAIPTTEVIIAGLIKPTAAPPARSSF
jgi:hypothetical protein